MVFACLGAALSALPGKCAVSLVRRATRPGRCRIRARGAPLVVAPEYSTPVRRHRGRTVLTPADLVPGAAVVFHATLHPLRSTAHLYSHSHAHCHPGSEESRTADQGGVSGGMLVAGRRRFGFGFARHTGIVATHDPCAGWPAYPRRATPKWASVHFRAGRRPVSLSSASRGRHERPATWLSLQGAKTTRPFPGRATKGGPSREGPPLCRRGA